MRAGYKAELTVAFGTATWARVGHSQMNWVAMVVPGLEPYLVVRGHIHM
jgi:hypothetical protein